MIDKNFIVTELDLDEVETALKEKIDNFLIGKFGSFVARQCESSVEYIKYLDENMRCFKDEFRCELHVEVKFKTYKYKHRPEHEEHIESIGMIFEYKGRQPFYIDGKFVSMNVFEWIQGMPIQKTDVIYGFSKDELYEMINDLVMDC